MPSKQVTYRRTYLGVVGNAVADGAEVVEREEDAGLGAAAQEEQRRHGHGRERERERRGHGLGHCCAADQLQQPALLRRHRANGLGGRGGQQRLMGGEGRTGEVLGVSVCCWKK